jgi:4'-phosphopantetheinyl transferase
MVTVSRTELQIGEVWDATSTGCPSELRQGVVHLWQRRLDASAEEVNACYRLLSNEEQERARRFRVERPRNDFVLTRGTLRSLLGQYLGCTPPEIRFCYALHGKPALEGNDLCFNVSHTHGLGLMAFAKRRAIGVDVENLRRETQVEQLAERFFSKRERDELKRLSGDELRAAFFRCWTRKEAYVKARGEGLSLPLDQFDVSVAPGESRALLATRPDSSEAGRWILRDVATRPGYSAALAVAETIDN